MALSSMVLEVSMARQIFILALILARCIEGKDYNVVLITVDDLKPTIGAYGDTVADTPNMDALLERGLRFENMQCQKSECAPSRASMISGKRNDAIKIWGFEPDFRKNNPDLMTWPGHMRWERNYRSEAVGKIVDNRSFFGSKFNGIKKPDWCQSAEEQFCSFDEYITLQDLWDESFTLDGEHPCGQYALRWPSDPVNPEMEADKQFQLLFEFPDELETRHIDYCVRVTAVKRLRALAERNQPFWLGIGFSNPHMPWTATKSDWDHFRKIPDSIVKTPPEYAEGVLDESSFFSDNSFTRPDSNQELQSYDPNELTDLGERARGYYASTRFVDRQIGEIMNVIDNELGEEVRENTIIIFWGDHGFHLGGYNDLWGKKTVFEHGTRVPAAIIPAKAWVDESPGTRSAGVGSYTDCPLDTVDLMPTVLDMLDLGLPLNGRGNEVKIAGTSLVPLFANPQDCVRSAAVSQYETYDGNNDFMGYSIRTKCFRLIIFMKLDKGTGVVNTRKRRRIERELYQYAEPGHWEAEDLIDDDSFNSIESNLESIVDAQFDRDWTHLIEGNPKPFDMNMC